MTWVWVAATSHGVLGKDITKAPRRGNTQCRHTWRKLDSLDMWRKAKVQLRVLEGNKYTSPHHFAQVKVIYVIMNKCAKCCCMKKDKYKKKKNGERGILPVKIFGFLKHSNVSIHNTLKYFVEGGMSVLQLGSLKVYNTPKWKFSKQTTSLYVLMPNKWLVHLPQIKKFSYV